MDILVTISAWVLLVISAVYVVFAPLTLKAKESDGQKLLTYLALMTQCGMMSLLSGRVLGWW